MDFAKSLLLLLVLVIHTDGQILRMLYPHTIQNIVDSSSYSR